MRVRDEAHRFAIRYQRQLKRRTIVRSELETIPGIGPKRRAALLTALGSLKAVKAADVDQLSAVIGKRSAQRIHAYFHPGKAADSKP